MSANVLHRIQWRRVQQSIVEEGVENVSEQTPSDPMETCCRGKNPSDCR